MSCCEEQNRRLTRTILLGILLAAYGSIVFVVEGRRINNPTNTSNTDIRNRLRKITIDSTMSASSASISTRTQNTNNYCAEIVTFEILDTITKEDFIKFANEANAPLQEVHGFVSRTLTVDDDNDKQWMDYVVWTDRESALKGAKIIEKDPRFRNFMSSIVGPSVVMKHSTILLKL
jgi:hypothetical protein